MPNLTAPFLSAAPPIVRWGVPALLAAALAIGLAVAFLTGGREESSPPGDDAAVAEAAPLPSEQQARIDENFRYIDANRKAINEMARNFNETNRHLAVINEQTAALLRIQQETNPAAISQRVDVIQNEIREINALLEQTRLETREILAIRTELNALQRQQQTNGGDDSSDVLDQELDDITDRITDLTDTVEGWRDYLETLSRQVEENTTLLNNPVALDRIQTAKSIIGQLSQCRVKQLILPPDHRLAPELLADQFARKLTAQLDDGDTTEEQLRAELDECERSLW